MVCPKCNAPVPDESRFCPRCGAAVQADGPQPVAPPQQPNTAPQAFPAAPPTYSAAPMQAAVMTAPANQGGNRRLAAILISCGGAFVLIVAMVATLLIVHGIRSSHYEEAVALLNAENYQEAKAAFVKMGDYGDSARLATQCQNAMDYMEATDRMKSGDYEGAKTAFLALGDYMDAADKAGECQDSMDYDAAMAMMNQKDYAGAKAAFEALGDFQDAADQAVTCGYAIQYDEAMALIAQGDFANAKTALDPLAQAGYSDAADQVTLCQNNLTYKDADTAAQQGLFYTAYTLFTQLGDFQDAASRADGCIQLSPNSGELYHNESYKSSQCSLIIEAPASGTSNTYLKIYSDGTLVSTLFILPQEKAKTNLPAGVYLIKTAYGNAWFGEQEMFGDEGSYQILTFDDGADTAQLDKNYNYTLTLQSGQDDGNVGSKDVGPDGF